MTELYFTLGNIATVDAAVHFEDHGEMFVACTEYPNTKVGNADVATKLSCGCGDRTSHYEHTGYVRDNLPSKCHRVEEAATEECKSKLKRSVAGGSKGENGAFDGEADTEDSIEFSYASANDPSSLDVEAESQVINPPPANQQYNTEKSEYVSQWAGNVKKYSDAKKSAIVRRKIQVKVVGKSRKFNVKVTLKKAKVD
ncbi:hypothetical protein CVT24_007701 [Panaeolus cyanescens]|uniref:Uncharacterized protein n=1 Tax=Panaeolus cyanescens TaxID=181874 RepID=A0A409VRJ6_9AGAR|nr:hypothetical protein CVT24_007701 [Panaeolus cyanescens]